jgi:hypothetical protein
MTFDAEHLAESLTTLLAEPAPPSTVDVARLLRDGRRTLRRRRAATALAGVAAAGLCGALVVAVLPAGPADRAVPATGTPAGAGIDPLTMNGTFGWLPTGFGMVAYEFNNESGNAALNEATAGNPAATAAGPMGPAELSLSTRLVPGDSLTSTTGKQRIGDINGHPAYWQPGEILQNNGTLKPYLGGNLVFQSPSGQWAQMTGQGVSESDMVRVAQSAVLTPKAIPLPIRITGLTTSLAGASAQISTDHGSWTDASVNVLVDSQEITVDATRPAAQNPCDPGSLKPSKLPYTKCATRVVNGLQITVTLSTLTYGESSGSQQPAPETGNPASYFRYVTSLGLDQAQWTTDVLVP